MRQLLRDSRQLASSDAIFLGSAPHPRGCGTFARLLGRHVRDLGDWTWGEAARHLSGHAAERFGLVGRGTLAPGTIADIAVVDPVDVRDNASYQDPTLTASGVDTVVVAGQIAVDHGELTGVTAGRALRAWDNR
jgi:N-acyl-D-amino-acid deacylase